MKKILVVAALAASSSVYAQEAVVPAAAPEAPLPVAQAAPAPTAVLPANTEVLLSMNQDVTTKGDTWKEGDNFDLSVVNDVMYGSYVVIPKGSRASGKITWLTSKGAFGKSGKMEVDLDYVEVGGRRIPLTGHYRQEGEGNTVATVGGVVLAGVFAGFVTGKSGRIPQGRELMAHTKSDLALSLPAGATIPTRPAAMPVTAVQAVATAPQPATAAPQPVMESKPVVQHVSAEADVK